MLSKHWKYLQKYSASRNKNNDSDLGVVTVNCHGRTLTFRTTPTATEIFILCF